MKSRHQFLLMLALIVFTAINLTPVFWALLTSLKQPVDAFAIPPKLIFSPTLMFHKEVWTERGFWSFLVNSMIVSVATVAISVPLGTMAGYALARTRSRHRQPVLFGILAVRMFPQILLAIPFFIMANALGLIDTYFALIVSFVAINQPFTIWLMRSFFVDIPLELDQAARIDGCNEWQVFFKVLLPVAKPGLVVAAIFSFLLGFNEFLFALILSGSGTKTLPVAIAEYGGEDVAYWSISAAAAIAIMLPPLILTLFAQKHLVRGMTVGAVKG
jgi:multiple sugar transport system permease protein